MKKIILAIIVLTLALVLAGCSSEPETVAASPEVVRARVVQVQRAAVEDFREAVGTVRAVQTSTLAAQVMGNVVAVHVREGDRVRTGQVLVVLDDAQLRAGLERANATVTASQQEIAATDADSALAETTLKRYRDLYDKKSVSPQEFDEVQARARAAAARRDLARAGEAQAKAAQTQARSGFEYTRVRAPFDGVITQKLADVGTLAVPGVPLLVLEDTLRFRLEASVDEADLGLARIGDNVPIAIEALGSAAINGRVVQIVPAADPASRSFVVKVELPASAGLRSGMFGRVRFPRGQRQAIVIPQSSVVARGQLNGVYVLGDKDVALLRYVTLGRVSSGNVEVLSGLENGDRIVADAGAGELSGKRVEVLP